MTLHVNLGPELEKALSDLVATGRYASETDVVREAVRLLAAQVDSKAELNALLAVGAADLDAGRSKPMAEVLDRLEAKYMAMVADPG